jgi:hypothetical protein
MKAESAMPITSHISRFWKKSKVIKKVQIGVILD